MADEIHIPIVGGGGHGMRMKFPVKPQVDIGLVTNPLSFHNGSFAREKYTLCYLLTKELEDWNTDRTNTDWR